MEADITTSVCGNICEKLITTYNASIIDMFNPELRRACIKEAQECANAPWRVDKKRNVLAKLIENYIDLTESRKSTPRYIEGPLNISCHWSEHFQKLIYIFGEFHGDEKDCEIIKPDDSADLSMSIEDYLTQYFSNPIAFTDFLVEMHANVDGYKDVEFFGSSDRLNRIRRLFQKCVDSTTRREKAECNLSRMHYFDIRLGEVKIGQNSDDTIISSLNPMSQFRLDVIDLITQITRFFTTVRAQDFSFIFIQGIRLLSNFKAKGNRSAILTVLDKCFEDTNGYINFFLTEFKQYKFLTKEIDRFNDESVKNLLYPFIKDELIYRTTLKVEDKDDDQNIINISNLQKLEKYTKLFIQTDLKLNQIYKDTYDENFVQKKVLTQEDQIQIINDFNAIKIYLNEMKNISVEYNALVIDAYLLARIFKTFKVDTYDPKKRRETDEPKEPHNIIIYAGNGHSQVYRKFLNLLRFEDKGTGGTGILDDHDIPKDGPRYCVDMKNINQPLFSGWPPASVTIPNDDTMSDTESLDEMSDTESLDDTKFSRQVKKKYRNQKNKHGIKSEIKKNRR